MRITFKLIASYLGIAAVIALLGLNYHHTSQLIGKRLSTVKQVAIIGIVDSNAMDEAIRSAHFIVYRHLDQEQPTIPDSGVGNDASREEANRELNRHFQSFYRSLERSRQSSAAAELSSPHADWMASLNELQKTFETHRALLKASFTESADHPAEARHHFEELVEPHFRSELLPLINAYQDRAEKEFAVSTQAIEQQLADNQSRSAILSVCAVLASICVGLWVSRQLVKPLQELRRASQEIGKGNFAAGVNIRSNDELGILGRAFNQMRDELQTTMVSRDRLEKALHEKEILLREVHHRVKNNLQIISSFLRLQSMESNDPELERLLGESQDRVRAMARIHEQLHQSDDLARIDIASYVHDLCKNLFRSHAADNRHVALVVDVTPVKLPLSVAIPCGLILNELVANTLSHAFTDSDARPEVTVVYRAATDRHQLGVRDNGRGMASIDPHRSNSLGLKLVRALAKQLQGELKITTDEGTSIMVDYPSDGHLIDEHD